MTDEEIEKLWMTFPGGWVGIRSFARAIEQATAKRCAEICENNYIIRNSRGEMVVGQSDDYGRLIREEFKLEPAAFEGNGEQ